VNGDPILLAVRHLPGKAWVPGLDPRRQPGIEAHVGHYAALLEAGKLVLGGPFLEADAGGFAVAAPGVGCEELAAFAAADPAVAAGLIRFELLTWFAPMRNPDLLRAGGGD
jgi:uncharacterized protein YciI